ncbi:hypothetical protein M378DRAFT_180179 [Amanita muscaria Koide BX008]|uniref:Prolyl 4-hydroxylase alpha subunit domain-containing protein n=1 Tax=Amanita muscaria (strain Koide BX008) TaxID=946122 RepID=A0A0C2WWH5_AMAMK|nr:hypothetical protein M378DRAFT_180179 [Amanita muscaria Koide BX008]
MSWLSSALPSSISFLNLNTRRANLRTIAEPPPIDAAPAPIFDFSGTALQTDYPDTIGKRYYVKIIDNVFSLDECEALVRFAETGIFESGDNSGQRERDGDGGEDSADWQPVVIRTNSRYGHQAGHALDALYRNSDRILRFSSSVASWVFDRLQPHISELVEIRPNTEWEKVVGKPMPGVPGGGGEVWRLVGVNERLSFLRYGKGMSFKEHCDSHVTVRDSEGSGARCGRVTIQIYLTSPGSEVVREPSRVEGGSTRLWSKDMKRHVDVEPKPGRVLVFQHRGVLHSGEEVLEGTKYTLRSDLMFRSKRVT